MGCRRHRGEERSVEELTRKWRSASQEERLHQKSAFPDLGLRLLASRILRKDVPVASAIRPMIFCCTLGCEDASLGWEVRGNRIRGSWHATPEFRTAGIILDSEREPGCRARGPGSNFVLLYPSALRFWTSFKPSVFLSVSGENNHSLSIGRGV